ncbi:hypothetical protein P6F26_13695 [Roseibacterium sp. SDUM158017]|uniref:hypothetical protein n=1 Tax=Roseicyclus salinarum TaxID=3036773 RepID=UPI0024154394|nr:hypothetical protein [Roseibacterium sp. SDUM158017]MDG4649491.1 hypothetical protein [Roseibacterium sp. SDUM158017]
MTRFGKFPTFALLLAAAALVATIFGVLLAQLSYSVGPSHFETVLFPQNGIGADTAPRVGAALVGAQGAWWAGVLIALPAFVYGLATVPRTESYLAAGLGAIGLVFVLATLTALLGLIGGLAAAATGLLDGVLRIPEGPSRADFLRAGFMQDAGLVAAGLGAFLAFWPMIRARRIDHARAGGSAA